MLASVSSHAWCLCNVPPLHSISAFLGYSTYPQPAHFLWCCQMMFLMVCFFPFGASLLTCGTWSIRGVFSFLIMWPTYFSFLSSMFYLTVNSRLFWDTCISYFICCLLSSTCLLYSKSMPPHKHRWSYHHQIQLDTVCFVKSWKKQFHPWNQRSQQAWTMFQGNQKSSMRTSNRYVRYLQQNMSDGEMAKTLDAIISDYTSQERQSTTLPELPMRAVFVNNSIGSWFRMTAGVFHDSLLSPSLFNIFLEWIMRGIWRPWMYGRHKWKASNQPALCWWHWWPCREWA